MFLMYVDESGDSGLVNSPTRYFALSGVVIHELRWAEYLERLVAFRRRMKTSFGLRLREEIHAAHMINQPGELARIRRNDRLSIVRFFVREIANLADVNIINVLVDKQNKAANYDVIENAWRTLVQRFANTIAARNFRGPANADDRGVILPDMSEVKKITRVIRRMRRYNPIPNQARFGPGYRDLRVVSLVDDPHFKDSRHSYFIQCADLAAFTLYQSVQPSSFAKKNRVNKLLLQLAPVLCRVASPNDPQGIVRL